MMINVSEENGITIVKLSGSVDGKTAPEVQQQVIALLKTNSKLILDFSNVDYLSSAGLRLLLHLHRVISERNGKIVLLSVSKEIQTIMSHTGFLKFYTLAESLPDAMQKVS